MRNIPIITIGRQFGSGGREIGEKLAGRLQIPFLDKELLYMASKKSGISQEVLESVDEKPSSSLLYSLSMGATIQGVGRIPYYDIPMNDRLFLLQSDAIKESAARGPCIIVGRCADYVLRDMPHHLRLFIYAEMPDRIRRISELYQVSPENAEALIRKTDKKRKAYYNFYTNKKWGLPENHDLCINSSTFGVEKTVDLLLAFLEAQAK